MQQWQLCFETKLEMQSNNYLELNVITSNKKNQQRIVQSTKIDRERWKKEFKLKDWNENQLAHFYRFSISMDSLLFRCNGYAFGVQNNKMKCLYSDFRSEANEKKLFKLLLRRCFATTIDMNGLIQMHTIPKIEEKRNNNDENKWLFLDGCEPIIII